MTGLGFLRQVRPLAWLVAALSVLLLPTLVWAQSRPEVLTLEQAVDLALQQQPSLRQTRAAAELARARVAIAQVPRRPTVTLYASAATGSTHVRPCSNDPSVGCGGFFDPSASTGFGAQANWRLHDFGQTDAAVRASELSAQAVAANLDTDLLAIRTHVEVRYLEAIARHRLVAVAEATVQSEATHLAQARKFVVAGAKDPIEVPQAQARAANARSALAQARSQEAIALANLRAAMGLFDPQRSVAVTDAWPTPPADDPPDLGALVETSRKQRPEMAQLDKEMAAAAAHLAAARAERRPVLSASASTQWGPDSNDWAPEPSWTAGLTLSWQLFDGGRAEANQRVAQAGVSSAQAQRDSLLVALTSQLELARAQISANRSNVLASTEAVGAARAQLKLAEGRYSQGVGSQIELTDAQTAVTTAEGNLVQAEWQVADAWAQLRRAVGEERR